MPRLKPVPAFAAAVCPGRDSLPLACPAPSPAPGAHSFTDSSLCVSWRMRLSVRILAVSVLPTSRRDATSLRDRFASASFFSVGDVGVAHAVSLGGCLRACPFPTHQ